MRGGSEASWTAILHGGVCYGSLRHRARDYLLVGILEPAAQVPDQSSHARHCFEGMRLASSGPVATGGALPPGRGRFMNDSEECASALPEPAAPPYLIVLHGRSLAQRAKARSN